MGLITGADPHPHPPLRRWGVGGGEEERGHECCIIHEVYGTCTCYLSSQTYLAQGLWLRVHGPYLLAQVGVFPLDTKGLGLCPVQHFCVSLESSGVTGTVRINTQ